MAKRWGEIKLNFKELEFNNLLVKLMKEHPDFERITQEPLFIIRDRTLRPDIVCVYKGNNYIVECKKVSPFTHARVLDYINQLKSYSEIDSQAKLALVIPSEIQDSYVEQFKKAGIIIWDIKALAAIFHAYLLIIKDSFLYDMLSGISTMEPKGIPDEYVDKLKVTLPGRVSWSQYQKLCVNIIELLFCPPLSKPLYEIADESKTNRKDIILPNYVVDGFWKFLRDKYFAEYIVIECKNYKEGIDKDNVLQVANYLKSFGTGLFGMVFSRENPKRGALVAQREQWVAYQKMILIVTDEDIIQMLKLQNIGGAPEDVLRQKVEDFRLSI